MTTRLWDDLEQQRLTESHPRRVDAIVLLEDRALAGEFEDARGRTMLIAALRSMGLMRMAERAKTGYYGK